MFANLSAREVAVFGMILAAAVIGVQIYVLRDAEVTAGLYTGSTSALEVVLARGDGQAFSQLAKDPLLDNVDVWPRGGRPEMAYRAQRPLAIYAAWAFSLGNPNWTEETTVIVTVLGCGIMCFAGAKVLQDRGLNPAFGLVMLLLPGIIASFRFLMPGALGLGLGVLGMHLWTRKEARPWLATGAFCLAVLARESMILFPAGLVLSQLAARRLPSFRLGLPLACYIAWWFSVRLLVGLPLSSASPGNRTSAPFVALLDVATQWETADWAIISMTVLLAVYAIFTQGNDPYVWTIVCGLALSTVLGSDVWPRWENFSRSLTPVHFGSALLLLTALRSDLGPRSSVDRASVS